eukprot:8392711-Pyramimonas_sp.AAC.1
MDATAHQWTLQHTNGRYSTLTAALRLTHAGAHGPAVLDEGDDGGDVLSLIIVTKSSLKSLRRLTHAGAHGPAVLDKGDDGGDAAGEVAAECLLRGRLVVRDHLLQHLQHLQRARRAARDLPGGVLDPQLPHHRGDLRRAAHPQRHLRPPRPMPRSNKYYRFVLPVLLCQ